MNSRLIFLFSALLSLSFNNVQADPTPTPTVMYNYQGGYLNQADTRQLLNSADPGWLFSHPGFSEIFSQLYRYCHYR